MSSSISSLPKKTSSSTHSLSINFRPYHKQHHKYTSPQVKLETIFTREPTHLKSLRLHYKVDKRKQNMTCINLGMDEDEACDRVKEQKKKISGNEKTKPTSSDRHQTKLISVASETRHKLCKRNRHQSLLNIADKYTLFSPNRKKKNLQKFEKKLTDQLSKANTQKKTNHDFTSGIKMFSYTNSKPISNTRFDEDLFKLKEQANFSSNDTMVNKWKFWAYKVYDLKHGFNEAVNLSNIQSRLVAKGKKRLTRCHLKQNKTLETIFPQSSIEQDCLVKKQISKQNFQQIKRENSPQKQIYQKTLPLKEKFKFKKIDLNHSDEKESMQTSNDESSFSKLRKLLQFRKSRHTKENNLIVAPWEYIPSERQFDIES